MSPRTIDARLWTSATRAPIPPARTRGCQGSVPASSSSTVPDAPRAAAIRTRESRLSADEGVPVVAREPSLGPVPPPITVVIPLASASVTIVGVIQVHVAVDAARGEDAPFAGDHVGGGADV